MGKMSFDLLSFLRQLTRNRGINPLEYHQTLKEASRRWGASSILRKDGIGIDLVYQEFECNYPGMFDSLDDFVEGLAERLGRTKTIYDKYDPEQIADAGDQEDILIRAQSKRLNKLEFAIVKDFIRKDGRKTRLNKNGIKRVLKIALEGEISMEGEK